MNNIKYKYCNSSSCSESHQFEITSVRSETKFIFMRHHLLQLSQHQINIFCKYIFKEKYKELKYSLMNVHILVRKDGFCKGCRIIKFRF